MRFNVFSTRDTQTIDYMCWVGQTKQKKTRCSAHRSIKYLQLPDLSCCWLLPQQKVIHLIHWSLIWNWISLLQQIPRVLIYIWTPQSPHPSTPTHTHTHTQTEFLKQSACIKSSEGMRGFIVVTQRKRIHLWPPDLLHQTHTEMNPTLAWEGPKSIQPALVCGLEEVKGGVNRRRSTVLHWGGVGQWMAGEQRGSGIERWDDHNSPFVSAAASFLQKVQTLRLMTWAFLNFVFYAWHLLVPKVSDIIRANLICPKMYSDGDILSRLLVEIVLVYCSPSRSKNQIKIYLERLTKFIQTTNLLPSDTRSC